MKTFTEFINESRSRTSVPSKEFSGANRKVRKANKSGNEAKAEYKGTQQAKREFFKPLKAKNPKLFREKYSNPVMGDDKHLTLTNKKKKSDQILVDFPGKEWHKMKSGVVTKVEHIPEGRFQGTDSTPKGQDGENRKIRRANKSGIADPYKVKSKYYISKVRERKQRRYGGSGLLGYETYGK